MNRLFHKNRITRIVVTRNKNCNNLENLHTYILYTYRNQNRYVLTCFFFFFLLELLSSLHSRPWNSRIWGSVLARTQLREFNI